MTSIAIRSNCSKTSITIFVAQNIIFILILFRKLILKAYENCCVTVISQLESKRMCPRNGFHELTQFLNNIEI